jgi:hypothetical protein
MAARDGAMASWTQDISAMGRYSPAHGGRWSSPANATLNESRVHASEDGPSESDQSAGAGGGAPASVSGC